MDTLLIKKIFDEALKQSPNDPESNGYGLLLAVIIALGTLCIAGIWLVPRHYIKYRDKRDTDDRNDRNEARSRASEQIDERIGELKSSFTDEIGGIKKEFVNFLREFQGKNADLGERLAKLETKIEYIERKEH